MMLMNPIRITTPDGGAFRAFAPGTCSFGAIQNGRTHTAS